ncbi:MAG: cyanophycinase [Planctomycetes bacterium]|nr:cyanophycinase [Planctomycetota bacterium]
MIRTALVACSLLATASGLPAEEIKSPPLPLFQTHAPASIPGTLFICGGGTLPPALIDRFFEFGGGENARVVIVTTASTLAGTKELEDKFDPWMARPHKSIDFFHARNRAEADSPEFCRKLDMATAIWFSGGDQNLLTTAYLGTHAWKQFHAVLKRHGVVGGTSAGAAIMSHTMIAGGRNEPIISEGFGFLPGTIIDQHFRKRDREGRLKQAVHLHPGHVGIGIDESTALIVRGRSMEAIGESDVTLYLAPSPHRDEMKAYLRHGEKDDLIKLTRAAIDRTRKDLQLAQRRIPEVKEGTLVIVGGGATPQAAVDKFLAAAGGKDAPIIVVSNAWGDDPPEEQKVCGWLKTAGANNVRQLHTRDQKELSQPDLLAWLKEARGVWFTGGVQWRLVDAYLDTPIQKLFQDVLHRGGVIGGTSAGASIQGEYLVRGNPARQEDMMAEGYDRGFCFLPGAAIDQQFHERDRLGDMSSLKKKLPHLVGIGIDESTALIVHGTTMEVVGQNQVSIFDRESDSTAASDYEVVKAGQKYDFKQQRLMDQVAVEAALIK